MSNCSPDNSFIKDIENEVEKANTYMTERTEILKEVMSKELKYGRSSKEYFLAHNMWLESHNNFYSYLKNAKKNEKLFRSYLNNNNSVHAPVMIYFLANGDKECNPVLDQIFTTLLDDSFVRTIDKYSDSITDTNLKRQLLETKYLAFLLNPDLERLYLGLDSTVNSIRSDERYQLIKNKAVSMAKPELCVYATAATDNVLLTSALRLESLASSLDEKNSSFILELIKDTIKRITSKKSDSVSERKILTNRKEAG